MAQVKILQIVTLSEMGGAQKVVYHIAAGLPQELFEVTVACAPGGELVRWLRLLPNKVRVAEIPELKRNVSPFFDLLARLRLAAGGKLCVIYNGLPNLKKFSQPERRIFWTG
ncbi:hypothetical membrane protein [Pelotomaculum thermopropionicum SI]|uniref:Hypothetical membrane protein n=1 Tax=Pelotomaculum thermopropionicum (strain DSM 13744 / JCM 10971 / SI) TaxID=370438 RepID=A5CZ39_PELTS|nr:hypothetical membrane protein [Pelotomaculum thermopropionicum SI]